MNSKFIQWEIFVLKAALVLGILFSLAGIVLGPFAAKNSAFITLDLQTSLSLGAQGALRVFLIGSALTLFYEI